MNVSMKILHYGKISLTVILLLFQNISSASAEERTELISIKEWKLIASEEEDPEKIKDIPPNSTVKTGRLFKSPYPHIKGFRYVWLTAEFEIRNAPMEYYGISLGRIYHTDHVFINGWPVGGSPEGTVYNVHKPRNYKIPPGLLKEGINRVSVKVGIYGAEHGGIWGDVEILPEEKFNLRKIASEGLFTQIPIGIAIFLFGQSIFHLIFFFWNRREKINIFAGLLFIIWAVFILALFTPYYPFDNEMRYAFIWSLTSFIPLLFLMLIQSYYRVYLTEYNMVLVPLLIISGIATLLFNDPSTTNNPGMIIGLSATLTMPPFLGWMMVKVHSIRPSNKIYIIFFFGLAPGLFIVWDIVNYIWIHRYPPLFHPYLLPVFILGVMLLIIQEHISNRVKLETLYSRLKEPEDRDRKQITPVIEEKFQKLITFINENYTSDLSREELAEAVNLSGDYMARNFKTFTGMRLNDYINNLRVKDAARKITETDQRIIEIAFEAGFESLTTFNRIFAKIIGEPPTAYRKRMKEASGPETETKDQKETTENSAKETEK